MRGWYLSTPIPESLIACAGIVREEVSLRIFFGVTVSPVVLVLLERGRDGERGRDVRWFGADM